MVFRYSTIYKAVNLFADYILLNVSLVAVYSYLDHSSELWLNNKSYIPVVLLFNLIWFLSVNVTGLYSNILRKDSVRIYAAAIKAYCLFASLLCVIILGITKSGAYYITREFFWDALVIFGVLMFFWKVVFLAVRKTENITLKITRKAVIVGNGNTALDLYNYFHLNPYRGYKLVGFFADAPTDKKIGDLELLGSIDECLNYVKEHHVDEIFCALPAIEAYKTEKLMLEADKNLVRFKIIPDYMNYLKRTTYLQNLGHIPVLSVRREPLESFANRLVKRSFDIIFSLLVIIFVFSWLFPILAIIIKLESRGPVFFVQERSGRNNRPFKCFKFRSMTVNRDSDQVQATKNDARVTMSGAFIRKTSLDELPQFFNVLIGNMSVVGPRPHMIRHTTEYSKLIEKFMIRHFLKPGITGWAQVNGLRGETKTTAAMEERIEADVWYLENWSFLLDMKIIFLTFYNVFRGEENAF